MYRWKEQALISEADFNGLAARICESTEQIRYVLNLNQASCHLLATIPVSVRQIISYKTVKISQFIRKYMLSVGLLAKYLRIKW